MSEKYGFHTGPSPSLGTNGNSVDHTLNMVTLSEADINSQNLLLAEQEQEVETPTLEDFVREVLDTRPGVLATRDHSANTFDRNLWSRNSLPTPSRSSASLRRTRSLHSSKSAARHRTSEPVEDIVVNDLESDLSIVEGQNVSDLNRAKSLRKSSAYLKHRVAEHRKTNPTERGVKASCWGELRYVKWPKIKSRLYVVLSQELWKGHLKEVEGHFGTAVVSYFVFLRWLFIMNVVIFLFWFSIICIPQFVYEAGFQLNRTSYTACLFPKSSFGNLTCSNSSFERTNGLIIYYSVPAECTSEEGVFQIQSCSFDHNNIAVSEDSSTLFVSSMILNNSCTQVSSMDTSYQSTLNTTISYIACVGIKAHTEWYQYILDFISGTGFFNETSLFQGVYPNSSLGKYDFSLAFLFMTGLIYALGVFLLIYKMGQAFNESYVDFGTKRKVNFCNKLFTAWDFNITNPKTAKLRQAHIRTEFHEELLDLHAREKKRSWKKLVLVIFIRLWTNLFVILALVGAGAAIFYSALYEFRISTSGVVVPILGEYLSAIVITILNAVLPLIFQLVARFEQYKTTSGVVRITLLRTIMVRLSSLIVLLGSLYLVLSQCTQQVLDDDDDECSINMIAGTLFNNSNASSETCPVCWETFIGQQFYKLGITNLLISLLSTILIESFRNAMSRVVVRIKWKEIGTKLRKIVTKGNFNIAKSILDLIYTQTLLWLGFLFSPFLPVIVLLTSFFIFYIKKYSLMWNLEPDKKGFQRSARTNFSFLGLMLFALFASIVPVLYAVTLLKPSTTCGPFRGQDTMYQSIIDLVNSWSCSARVAVDFFSSSTFIIPLIVFLLLLCYALYVILKAREARFQLIKKQLILEGANVTHIVGNLDNALQQLARVRANQPEQETLAVPLSEALERRSRLLNDPVSPVTVNTTVF